MPILYKEAKAVLAQYAGRAGVCVNAQEVDLFVREVLEYLLISGTYGNEHKFVFHAQKGCITLPYELETPLKVKIEGEVGTVWDRWFEYHSTRSLGEDCVPATEALYEDPNKYPTVYELPLGGAHIGFIGTCEEAPDAHGIVQGMDPSGREIFTIHKGEQVRGEYIGIQKGVFRTSSVKFGQITSLLMTKTNGYKQLLWHCPENNKRGFLSDYSPLEEKPSYRRFRLRDKNCKNVVKVSILGRIKLKEAYADNDYIPFDTLYTIHLAGQAINAQYNSDVQTAAAKDQAMVAMINRENSHKKVGGGQPVEVFYPLSAGSIQNIVWGTLGRRR